MKNGFIIILPILALLIHGCTATDITKIGTSIAADQGYITDDQKGAIDRTGEAFRKSFEELTEEEEYYIGRSVAATIFTRYRVYRSDKLTQYVNRVGRTVTLFSSRPEIYNGYHFIILDTDEVNAFAAPGGFIMITRGMLAMVPDEEALAAVLAHEVAHVAGKHGLAAIKKSRLIDAFAILGKEAGAAWNKEELTKLTGIFEGAVGDVVRTLVESGYSRGQEKEADRFAVEFASAVGYEADGITRFLKIMSSSGGSTGGIGLYKTHPAARDRIKDVSKTVEENTGKGTDPATRTERFEKIVRL